MKKLIEESDLKEKNSVYDFLYHDIERIGSFLSQFDKDGLLTSHTHTSKTSKGEGSSSTEDIKGGFDPVISAKISATNQTNSLRGNDSTKTYDPLWKNSLSLLAYLEQMNMLKRDLSHANIGQFVLLYGELYIFDIGFFQKIIQKPVAKQTFTKGFVGASSNNPSAKNEAHGFIELVTTLPDSIQVQIIGDNFSTWSTLRKDGLSISTDDLFLKHGSSIAGNWNVLGILDALPDDIDAQKDFSFLPIFQKNLADYFKTIRPLGRDPGSFGITPLLVFREVTGN